MGLGLHGAGMMGQVLGNELELEQVLDGLLHLVCESFSSKDARLR